MVILVVGLAAGLSYLYLTISNAGKNFEKHINEGLDTLSTELAVPLWNLDVVAINFICKERHKNLNVSAIRIIDDRNITMCSEGTINGPGLRILQRDIVYKDEHVGRVELALHTDNSGDLWKNIMGAVVIVLAVVLIAAIITVQILLRRHLVSPMHNLREGVNRLDQGEYDQLLPANEKQEINAIAMAINSLASKLFEREKEVKQYTDELEQIVYVTSHDLRSPLVNVSGYSGELKDSLDDIASLIDNEGIPSEIKGKIVNIIKESREYLEYINSGASSMDSLLNGLLQFSRSGRVMLQKEELDMNMLMSSVADGFEFQLKENGAKLQISDLPVCIGDEGKISQLFSNLISNALKYCSPDRPCIIEVSGITENSRSVYCVQDNGIGIAPEYHEKIFEIFHQLEPSATGEGLGLSIVLKIVERHKGKIWVESEPGTGSKFYVSLLAATN